MPEKRIDSIGKLGLNTDVLPSLLDLAALTTAFNVRSEDGSIKPVSGSKRLFYVNIRPIYHTAYRAADGGQFLVYSNGETVYATSVSAIPTNATTAGPQLANPDEVNITPLSGAWNGGQVSFTVLNGVLVINSASNGPFYWTGGINPLQALPGWDSGWTCRQMVAWREHLVALAMYENGTNYPHKYRGSTAAGPGEIPTTWLPAPDNYAFTGILADTQGQIVGGVAIKDTLWVVKEDAVCFVDWVGGDFIATPRRSIGNIGTQLFKGFVELNGALVLISTSDLWLFDGVNIRSLVDQRVRTALRENISNDRWDLAQLHAADSYTVLVIQGAAGGADRHNFALVLDIQENVWTTRELNYGYGADNSMVNFVEGGAGQGDDNWNSDIANEDWLAWSEVIWQRSVYSPSAPVQVVYESNPEDTVWWVSTFVPFSWTDVDGNPLFCKVERLGAPVSGTSLRSVMGPFWFDLETTIPIKVWVGGMQNQGDTPRWKGPITFTPGKPPVIRTRISGRYLCWRIETEQAGSWRLGSIMVNWEPDGER